MNAKQNPTRDHHYVPVCYLKQFIDPEKNRVSSLNLEYLNSGFPVRPKWFAPRQFCYIENYYTISEDLKEEFKDFDVYDALHIESDLFGILENRFPKLVNMVIRERTMPIASAADFADLVLQMKIRNPYWLQGMVGKTEQWLDEIYPKLADQFVADPKYQHYSEELKRYALEKEIIRTRKSPLLNKRLQLHSLIQRNTPGSKGNVRLRQAMLQTNWVLLKATGTQRFITTDNPGFAVDKKLFHNIKLKDYFRFYLPLSPRHCLMLGEGTDHKFLKKRKVKLIIFRAVTDQFVAEVNQTQLKNAFRYAIADNEDFLNTIKKT